MCQCLLCGCWWINYCGVCCGGCHEAYCIYSWWCCKPIDLRLLDPACCHICAFDGFGYNYLYFGSILFASKAVQEWSGLRSEGRTASDLNSGKTIIINNSIPSPIYMQGGDSNYGSNYNHNVNVNANANLNTNLNTSMNVKMGGMGYEMSTNVGGANVNMNMGTGYNGNAYYNGGGNVNANVNLNPNPMNVNMSANTPGMNAKISF